MSCAGVETQSSDGLPSVAPRQPAMQTCPAVAVCWCSTAVAASDTAAASAAHPPVCRARSTKKDRGLLGTLLSPSAAAHATGPATAPHVSSPAGSTSARGHHAVHSPGTRKWPGTFQCLVNWPNLGIPRTVNGAVSAAGGWRSPRTMRGLGVVPFGFQSLARGKFPAPNGSVSRSAFASTASTIKRHTAAPTCTV